MSRQLRVVFLSLLAVWAMLLELECRGQSFGVIKGFKVAEPYGPPYEKQTKSLLEAGKALLVPGGAFLSEGVLLRTFSETNTAELVVRAEQCIYNSSNHTVHSAQPIHMQTADGKFSLEGEGFYWQQTNSSLSISNKVHTVIQGELLQSPSTNRADKAGQTNSGPLSIFSERFTYDGTAGQGVWRENVRVNGTNLTLNSGVLTAEVPMTERQVRSLLAEKDVVFDYNGLHATGARLAYNPGSGLARLSTNATWQAEQREGHGDELIMDPTNRTFQVQGNAWLKLPGQALGEAGFLSFSNAPVRNSPGTVQRSVEICCDHYEIRTNLATFHDRVRLEERLDNTVHGRMTCNLMSATFGPTNELRTIVADKDVIIEEEDKRFTGGRAFYTHTNTTLEISQNPQWRAGSREGQGDLLRLNTQQSELLVSGHALLRMPAGELAGQLSPTNQATSRPQPSRTVTNQVAEIHCQEYKLRQDTSVFRGDVHVTHPEMSWTCEKLTVEVPTPGLTNVVAVQKVVFDLTTQNEGKVHGKSDEAVYSFGAFNTVTNGMKPINQLQLTGAPAVLTNLTKGIGVENRVVIWDRFTDKAILPGGDYKIQGSAPAIATNTLQLPKGKLTK